MGIYLYFKSIYVLRKTKFIFTKHIWSIRNFNSLYIKWIYYLAKGVCPLKMFFSSLFCSGRTLWRNRCRVSGCCYLGGYLFRLPQRRCLYWLEFSVSHHYWRTTKINSFIFIPYLFLVYLWLANFSDILYNF